MTKEKKSIIYADDDTETVPLLLKIRLPSLLAGLVLGIGISFVTSRFEDVLAHNIQVAFFLPFIVYMAAAIGTQTEAIYSRDLRSGRAKFHTYLVKETLLGVIAGLVLGGLAGGIVLWWLNNAALARSVGLSMFAAVASAPLVALCVTEVVESMHKDPAAGAGPIATVIQDMLSIIIYGVISSSILLS